jgi:hypothetical protein
VKWKNVCPPIQPAEQAGLREESVADDGTRCGHGTHPFSPV